MLGTFLHKELRSAGMSKEDLAYVTQIPLSHIILYEANKKMPTPKELALIFTALGIKTPTDHT